MGSSTEGAAGRMASIGRSFACMDPERQREVTPSPIRASESRSTERTIKPARTDWMRVQPDRESGSYEGGSSRRWR